MNKLNVIEDTDYDLSQTTKSAIKAKLSEYITNYKSMQLLDKISRQSGMMVTSTSGGKKQKNYHRTRTK